MKLISNIASGSKTPVLLTRNEQYEFVPDEGGGLYCERLGLGLSDPCFAIFTFRSAEAPVSETTLETADQLYRRYRAAAEEADMESLLGLRFNMLCWKEIPGEFQKNQIYEVEIMDLYGFGTDGFVSLDGYNVATVQEALEHFVITSGE